MNCPACGASNPEGGAACWKCYAPLTAQPAQPAQPGRPAEETRPVATVGHRPAEQESRTRKTALLPKAIVLLALLALVVAAGWWWFFVRIPNTPEGIVRAYVKAQQRIRRKVMEGKPSDLSYMIPFVTKKDVKGIKEEEAMVKRSGLLDQAANLLNKMTKDEKRQLKQTEKKRECSKVDYKVQNVSSDKVIVTVKREFQDGGDGGDKLGLVGILWSFRNLPVPYIVVKEEGRWKIDLAASQAEIMKAVMEKMGRQWGLDPKMFQNLPNMPGMSLPPQFNPNPASQPSTISPVR